MRRSLWLSVIGLITASLTVSAGPSASAEAVDRGSDASVSAVTSLRNVNSGLCLDITWGSTAPGAKAIQWPCRSGVPSQRFEVLERENGSVAFRALHSNQCLDIAAASTEPGAHLTQWPCNFRANQRFRRFNAGGVWFDIRPVHAHPGMCLDTFLGSKDPGVNVIQWDCHPADSQLWFYFGSTSAAETGRS